MHIKKKKINLRKKTISKAYARETRFEYTLWFEFYSFKNKNIHLQASCLQIKYMKKKMQIWFGIK